MQLRNNNNVGKEMKIYILLGMIIIIFNQS
jgi:hypothetical protein